MAHKWVDWLHNPCRLGGPRRSERGGGGGSELAYKWANWLHSPSPGGGGGSPMLLSGVQNQQWLTMGG